MGLARRAELERSRFSREVPQSHKMPMLTARFGNGELVARDLERCAFPAVGRFHLDQTIAAVALEALNVETGAVAIQMRYPANAFGEIRASGSDEAGTLSEAWKLKAGLYPGIQSSPRPFSTALMF